MNYDSQHAQSEVVSLPPFGSGEDNASWNEEGYPGEDLGYLGSPKDDEYFVQPLDERPASERISELLQQMAPRRRVLLKILEFCQELQPVKSVNVYVDELQQTNHSVYTPANLCRLLSTAGALELLTKEGTPADAAQAPEPKVVVVDGVEYLEAAEPAALYWHTTEAGNKALEEDQPLERFFELVNQNKEYYPLYQRVLELCSAEKGATSKELGAAIDSDPLVQDPRRYASYFVERLERCDTLEWQNNWHITSIGRSCLDFLKSSSGN